LCLFIEDWEWGFFLAYGSAIILSFFVHVVNSGSICICYMSSLTGAKTKHNLMNEWINEQLFVTHVKFTHSLPVFPWLALFGLSVNLLGPGEARTQSIHPFLHHCRHHQPPKSKQNKRGTDSVLSNSHTNFLLMYKSLIIYLLIFVVTWISFSLLGLSSLCENHRK
jgi:hypothetical protein